MNPDYRLCKYCDATLPDDGETQHDPECPWYLGMLARQKAVERDFESGFIVLTQPDGSGLAVPVKRP